MSVDPDHAGIAVTCPECGTVATVAARRRAATDFCPSCDYPLFWARTRPELEPDAAGTDARYRAPGTAGAASESALTCPECGEQNPASGRLCLRCGADLRPAPPPAPQAPPPPAPTIIAPAPIVRCSHPPMWVVAAISSVLTLAVTLTVLWLWH